MEMMVSQAQALGCMAVRMAEMVAMVAGSRPRRIDDMYCDYTTYDRWDIRQDRNHLLVVQMENHHSWLFKHPGNSLIDEKQTPQ